MRPSCQVTRWTAHLIDSDWYSWALVSRCEFQDYQCNEKSSYCRIDTNETISFISADNVNGTAGTETFEEPLRMMKHTGCDCQTNTETEDEDRLFFTVDRWMLRMSMCQSTRDDAAPSFIELTVVNTIGRSLMKRKKRCKSGVMSCNG